MYKVEKQRGPVVHLTSNGKCYALRLPLPAADTPTDDTLELHELLYSYHLMTIKICADS